MVVAQIAERTRAGTPMDVGGIEREGSGRGVVGKGG